MHSMYTFLINSREQSPRRLDPNTKIKSNNTNFVKVTKIENAHSLQEARPPVRPSGQSRRRRPRGKISNTGRGKGLHPFCLLTGKLMNIKTAISQHACCEHVYFVSGIRGESPNAIIRHPPCLDALPTQRKRGRKRKQSALSRNPQARGVSRPSALCGLCALCAELPREHDMGRFINSL